jgi:hypothetical protein
VPIPKGKLEPQVAMTLLKFATDTCGNDSAGVQKMFNMLCDLYKRETMEDLIHG